MKWQIMLSKSIIDHSLALIPFFSAVCSLTSCKRSRRVSRGNSARTRLSKFLMNPGIFFFFFFFFSVRSMFYSFLARTIQLFRQLVIYHGFTLASSLAHRTSPPKSSPLFFMTTSDYLSKKP